MRWRLSQLTYPRLMDASHGYFCVGNLADGFSVGMQPHPASGSVAVNHCILGRGKTEGTAIDRMIVSLKELEARGVRLSDDIQNVLLLEAEDA